MANAQLLHFYRGEGEDDVGRRIADVWQYSLDDLEGIHDYIQWLFPLDERSAFNPHAPLLDAETKREFRRDETLRANVERSLRVMLTFYGFALSGDRITRGPYFVERSRQWLRLGNHNFLRLTRILKSLSLLGHEQRAEQLLTCLEDVYRERTTAIGSTTLGYWRRAVDGER